MHEVNYQQLYHTFVDFCIGQEKALIFHNSLEWLHHTFIESYIDQENILLQRVIF